MVRWTVLAATNDRSCEQELMLSVDGGKTNSIRMSRMLSPSVREIPWTVPDVGSQQAVIDVRYGCNGNVIEPPSDVPMYPQVQARFVIAQDPTARLESVSVLPFRTSSVAPGGTVTVAWKSTVGGVDQYELLVSFDGGAHFYPAGRTTGTSMAWKAPRDTYGGVLFQVVAHRFDGSTVGSYLPVRDHLLVGRTN